MPSLPFGNNVYMFSHPSRPPLRRALLWELAPPLHCAVIGTCLGIDELRSLLDDLFAGTSHFDDYALHAGTVRECATRNKVSEMLQAELERRYESDLQQLDIDADDADLDHAWVEATRRLDVAGVFWAFLTHPRCSEAQREQLVRDVHMMQHRSLAQLRRQRHFTEKLIADNDRLRRELADRGAEREPPGAAHSSAPPGAAGAPAGRATPGFLARLRRLVQPRRFGHSA